MAVEPSEKMREEALRHRAHPRVAYRDGAASAIPAADAEFDFAFLSMVIHHVRNVAACARELHRVVKPDGLVFIRNVFSGRLDSVRYYEFFPSARAIDEARLSTVDGVRDAFVASGVAWLLHLLEQDGEFVAAEPRKCINGSQTFGKPARDLDEKLVAREVSEGVVDDLEMVEIHEQHRERIVSIATGAFTSMAQALDKARPIW